MKRLEIKYRDELINIVCSNIDYLYRSSYNKITFSSMGDFNRNIGIFIDGSYIFDINLSMRTIYPTFSRSLLINKRNLSLYKSIIYACKIILDQIRPEPT